MIMLRVLRRKLHAIDYYSARRERSLWTRLRDAALPVTLLATLPIVALMNLVLQRPIAGEMHHGTIWRDLDHAHTAIFDDFADERPSHLPRSTESPAPDERGISAGQFRLYARHAERGWPLTTSRVDLPIDGEVELYRERGRTRWRMLDDENGARMAIIAALSEKRAPQDLVQAHQVESHVTVYPLRWLGNAMIWWALLYLGAAIALVCLHFAVTRIQRRVALRARRLRRSGRCPNCAYDLRGLEFSDRCPECGDLSW